MCKVRVDVKFALCFLTSRFGGLHYTLLKLFIVSRTTDTTSKQYSLVNITAESDSSKVSTRY